MPVMRLIAVALAVLLLSACGSTMRGVWDTARDAVLGAKQPTGKGLDPAFNYLRVSTGRRTAFLAMGYVDPHPSGPIEVWFSADREVLRLQDGRLVGATGTLTEWRQVQMPPLPAWRELVTQNRPLVWERRRDVMPGYLFGVVDKLQLVPVAPPAASALLGRSADSLRWFEETQVADAGGGAASLRLRPARYAVEITGDSAQVVYGEQCLAADLCLTWQRWQAQP